VTLEFGIIKEIKMDAIVKSDLRRVKKRGKVATFEAPAKINLHLAVGEKRSDGFHPLESLFIKIPLFDSLRLSVEGAKKLAVEVHGLENLCEKGEDTMSKAFMAWCAKAQLSLSATIDIIKRIPSQAGLGGGSSDAAAVLIMLDRLYPESRLTFSHLMEIALEVGSDVPFFVHNARVGYVTGRGECIEAVDVTLPKTLVLAMPQSSISTKNAYQKLDQIQKQKFLGKKILLEEVQKPLVQWERGIWNDFLKVTDHDALDDLKKAVYKQGLDGYFSMSGSGSCNYVFIDENLVKMHDKFDKIAKSLSTCKVFSCQM